MTNSAGQIASHGADAHSDVTPTRAQPGHSLPIGAFELCWSDNAPAALSMPASTFVGRTAVALVDVFTAREQRARTSQAYWRSAVGERLRVRDSQVEAGPDSMRVIVIQIDAVGGIEVRTTLTSPHGTISVRIESEVRNIGESSLVLTAVSSATIGFGASQEDLDHVTWGAASSEWLAENRWSQTPLRELLPYLALPLHQQDARGHAGITSHGAWSSGEHVPCGHLVRSDGQTLAWQIETSAGWHADVSQSGGGGVLALLGPTDLEHQFAHELRPGDVFATVPVALAASLDSRDDAIAELTRHRRWLRREANAALPVVYNDFMNTLMGQPSTERLLPLIRGAAAVGAEVFCIDAGWFADPAIGDWWATVGEWREAPSRFPAGGLRRVIDAISGSGMIPGLWLEPEVVGIHSPVATALPDDAFFQRFGVRVEEDRRYHLDFRNPRARAHLDATVDHLVEEYGIGFLKLDYNINPGAGTDVDATAAGDGLLAHTRAFREWLVDVQARHPALLVENCSSGAMRADYALLATTHMQSTSDQQDFRLYPPIAASAPASILPEQCGNWAYPAEGMTDEETVLTLVSGLSGRLYLSGFLGQLRPSQQALVAEAVALHKRLRGTLANATPFWPLGLPTWDAPTVCLGLRSDDHDLLFVWDRDPACASFVIPGIAGDVEVLFPGDSADDHASSWSVAAHEGGLVVTTSTSLGARVLEVRHR